MERTCRIPTCRAVLTAENCKGINGSICDICNKVEKTEWMREKRRDAGAVPRHGYGLRKDEFGRQCLRCLEYKLWDGFHKQGASLPTQCKPCWNRTCLEGRWRRNFGLSPEDYAGMLSAQDIVCALCFKPETAKFLTQVEGEVQSLSVDHWHGCLEHETSKGCKKCIRGLLCKGCNVMLGYVEKSPDLQARFADYLDRRPLLDFPG